jgi:hypothetical protein
VGAGLVARGGEAEGEGGLVPIGATHGDPAEVEAREVGTRRQGQRRLGQLRLDPRDQALLPGEPLQLPGAQADEHDETNEGQERGPEA